jgi:hypothetical protein
MNPELGAESYGYGYGSGSGYGRPQQQQQKKEEGRRNGELELLCFAHRNG